MDSREYLRSFLQMERDLKTLQEEVEYLETHALYAGIKYSSDSVQVARNVARMADNVEKITKAREILLKKTAAVMLRRKEMFCLLEELPDVVRRVLYLRYMQGHSWEKMPEMVNYSLSACHRIHREGLKQVQRLLDDRERENEKSRGIS